MYKSFYGLTEYPFNITSDPSFLYMSRHHQEAFSCLTYGIEQRKGFLEITGEIGTGKTTLCRALLNRLDDGRTKTAYIFNPDLSGLQLLRAIVEDFDIHSPGKAKIDIFRALNKFLIEQLQENNNVILIIDEAQNMRPSLLEEVRMLSNLETETEKLIQIVLVGQPELRDKLRRTSLEQLRQRIGVRYHVMPLDEDELYPYIQHRLLKAGATDNGIKFNQDTIFEIYKYSKGTPRLINILCDKILLYGFVNNLKHFTGDMVQKSVREIEGVFV